MVTTCFIDMSNFFNLFLVFAYILLDGQLLTADEKVLYLKWASQPMVNWCSNVSKLVFGTTGNGTYAKI